jgi:hypothetical protein
MTSRPLRPADPAFSRNPKPPALAGGAFTEEGFPISAFHSVECESGEGEFFGIQKEIRQTFPPRLAILMPKRQYLSIWSAVVKEDWWEATNEAFRAIYPDPFYFCFEHCAREMAHWSERVAGGSDVALVYSEQLEFQNRIQTIWSAYDRAKNIAPLSSFATASYKKCVPLQAADLMAYECFKYWDALEFTDGQGRSLPLRPAMDILSDGASGFGGLHTKQTIARAVKSFQERGTIFWDQ